MSSESLLQAGFGVESCSLTASLIISSSVSCGGIFFAIVKSSIFMRTEIKYINKHKIV